MWPGRPVPAQEPPVRFRLGTEAALLRPGGEFVLTLAARIPRGWHLYGLRQPAGGPLPTTVAVGPEPFALAAPVTGTPPRVEFDLNFGLLVAWHDDSASFRVPIRAARTALPGTYDAEVRVSYQRCNDRICLPLTTDTLRLLLTVAGAPEPLAAAAPAGLTDPAGRASGAVPDSPSAPPSDELAPTAAPAATPVPAAPFPAPEAAGVEVRAGRQAGWLLEGGLIVVAGLALFLALGWQVVRRHRRP
ncbi:MAG: hypothetical protein FIB01_01005 [Gemmatimonadetes bacterium]|nr:hypothetical protein [Gemmatimonadota bacterium]